MDQVSALELLKQLYGTTLGVHYKPPRRKSTLSIHYHNRQNFFDLPAEVRNIIYSFAAVQDTKPILALLRLPGMCRASKLMRQESLPFFFDLNTFIIEAVTPLMLDEVPDPNLKWATRAHFYQTADTRRVHAGKMLLRPEMDRLLRDKTLRLRIRNIDLVPVSFETPLGWRCEHLNAVLSLRSPESASTPHVSRHVHGSRISTYLPDDHVDTRDDLEHLTGPALAYLQSTSARRQFNGLTLSEITLLAQTFRVPPPTGPEARLDNLM